MFKRVVIALSGLVASASCANAAGLSGTVGINSFTLPTSLGVPSIDIGGYTFLAGSEGGVALPIVTDNAGDFLVAPFYGADDDSVVYASDGVTPRASYNLRPDDTLVSDIGAAIEIVGTGDFTPYIGNLGIIKDISEADAEKFIMESKGVGDHTIVDLLTVYALDNITPVWTFTLTNITEPEITSTPGNTGSTISVGFIGYFTDSLTGVTTKGRFTNSIDFVGLNKSQVIDTLLTDDGSVNYSYSASGTTVSVPEKDPNPLTYGAALLLGMFGLNKKRS